MSSQAEAHLSILDHCNSRSLRRAYLVLLLACERAGLRCATREQTRELLVRDDDGVQFLVVAPVDGALLLLLCRPALAANPGLAADAMDRFPGRVRGGAIASEICIVITLEMDAEDVVEWLFPSGNFILGTDRRLPA